MFKEYLYINRKEIIDTIYRFSDVPSYEFDWSLSLNFIQINSDFSCNRRIEELTDEQLAILVEKLFNKVNNRYYFDTNVYDELKLSRNVFVKKKGKLNHIEKSVDGIKDKKSSSSNNFFDNIFGNDNIFSGLFDRVSNVLVKKPPLYIFENNIGYYFEYNEKYKLILDNYKTVTVVGKIKNVSSGNVKIYDPNNGIFTFNIFNKPVEEDNPNILYLEGDRIFHIEILYITNE